MVKYVSIKDVSLSVASGITKKKASRGKYNVYGSTGIIGYSNLYDYSGVKILVARVGANAGTINIVDGKYGVSDNTIIIDVSQQYNVKYVYYQLKYLNLHSLIFGSGQPLITGTQLKQLKFRNVELKEQVTIVKALSDIDSLISSLQKLIEKKKAIKQGAMQELLTGKKRLPGFYGKWKHGVWKDVLAGFYSGATPYRGRADYYKGNIRWVSSGELNYNIIKDTIEHISEKAKNETSLVVHPAGTFLMAITGLEAAGTRGSCAILGKDATTNQSCMAIYGTDKMVIPYLYHYYLLNGEELAFQYCQGTKQQSYTAAIVKELPIYYPCDIVEQQAIAQVLSDMDSEIEQLEKKLAKYQQIKQGMMQELLTGQIRLVDADGKDQPQTQAVQKKQPQQAHNQHFDDAVMIAGIVNAFYSEKYPLGRKKSSEVALSGAP